MTGPCGKTSYIPGVSVDLITADEVDAAIYRLMDEWPESWRSDSNKRLAIDTLHDCSVFVRHFEDAARNQMLAPSLLPLVTEMFAPYRTGGILQGALTEADVAEPEELRKQGAI